MPKKSLVLSTSALAVLIVANLVAGVAHPQPADAAAKNRVFEIRTYTTEDGRLDALHARFRDHTSKLFEKHGIQNIGYWTPSDEPRAKNTLIYVVAHASRAAAAKNWQAFIDDPAWQKARAESEAGGPIVTKVESVFVDPTDYSPIK